MSDFESALLDAVAAPRAYAGRVNVFLVSNDFVDLVRANVAVHGTGGLTKEQFIAVVSTAFDLFTAAIPAPYSILVKMAKPVVLVIAGRIWDKRNPS